MPSPTSILPILAGTSLLLLALPLTRSVQVAQDEHLAYLQQKREKRRPVLKGVREELEGTNDSVQKNISGCNTGGQSGGSGEMRSSGNVLGKRDGGITGQGAWLDWVDME